MSDIKSILGAAIELSRADRKQLPNFVKFAKLSEEVGELSEAVLQRHNFVAADKAGVGTVLEEAADVIFQVIDILQAEQIGFTSEGLLEALEQMMEKKLAKWVAKKMDLPAGVADRVLSQINRSAETSFGAELDKFWASIEDGTVFDGISDQVWQLADRIVQQQPDLFAEWEEQPASDLKAEVVMYPVCVAGKWYDTIVDHNGVQSFVGIGPVRALFNHQHAVHNHYELHGGDVEDLFGDFQIAIRAATGGLTNLDIVEGSILAGGKTAPIIEMSVKWGFDVINSYPDGLGDIEPINDLPAKVPQGDPKNPKPGDHFAVRVDGRLYDTVIDPAGTQRFVVQPVVNAYVDHNTKMFNKYWMERRIENHHAVYGLNEIATDFVRGKWSRADQIEFYTMFGYSVSGFSGLSFVDGIEIDNPLWKE